jgi:hypothetical protein
MTDQMPGAPGQPPKKGLSTGAIVAIVIIALVLILFGICVGGPVLFNGA